MAKILLAEDDLFIRDIYSEVLENENFELTVAKDGAEAFEKIMQGNWDIVLLDIIMPKMTGIEILEELKEKNLHSLAKHIILMTNTEETKELSDVNEMYDDFILKSAITPGDLLERIEGYLKE